MRTRTFSPLAVVLAMYAVWLCAPLSARAEPDFGNGSSGDLTTGAWKAFGKKDYKDALACTNKCIEAFREKALEQQKNKTSPHPVDEVPWALNDVAACYYIQGLSEEALGKTPQAIKDYKFLVDKLNLATCAGDHGDWYPYKAAADRLTAIQGGAGGVKTPDVIISANMGSITVRTAKGADTYKISPATKIDVKGAAATYSDLKAGMNVTVTPDASDPKTALSISAGAP